MLEEPLFYKDLVNIVFKFEKSSKNDDVMGWMR